MRVHMLESFQVCFSPHVCLFLSLWGHDHRNLTQLLRSRNMLFLSSPTLDLLLVGYFTKLRGSFSALTKALHLVGSYNIIYFVLF